MVCSRQPGNGLSEQPGNGPGVLKDFFWGFYNIFSFQVKELLILIDFFWGFYNLFCFQVKELLTLMYIALGFLILNWR